MYKALVFDFDFTLGDSAAGIADSINYALGRLGYCLLYTSDAADE